MTIGQRIKDRRTELGYSVEELALKLGKNRATVYRYENGDIKDMPTQILEPLAKALNTTPAELMGWTLETTAPKPTLTLTGRDEKHMRDYAKLTDIYKDKVDALTRALLSAQTMEEDLLLAAHARDVSDPDDVSRDIEMMKDMRKENS